MLSLDLVFVDLINLIPIVLIFFAGRERVERDKYFFIKEDRLIINR